MNFTVYIDESGDAGISKVRDQDNPGASEYFVLGAIVVPSIYEQDVINTYKKLRLAIRKRNWKHATDLGHSEKVFVSREMASLNVRYFGLISNKSTLGEYKGFINADPQKYYNKCVIYLLENVCLYLNYFKIGQDNLRIVFEKRNHNYEAMRTYIKRIQQVPLYPKSEILKMVNPFSIVAHDKGKDECLEFADMVAHFLYQCVNKSPNNHYIPEPRYFKEISTRFGCDREGRVSSIGLKFVHDVEMLKIDPDIKRVFLQAKALLPAPLKQT